MSVEAINPATPVEKKSNIGTVATATIGTGAVGALGGYFMGGKRPTLEEVFTQKPDTFSSQAVKNENQEAAEKLQKAVTEKNTAVKAERDAVKDASAKKFAQIKAQDVEKKLTDDLDTAKAALDKKADEEAAKIVAGKTKKDIYGEVKIAEEKLKNAKADLEAAGESATEDLKKAVTTAENELNTAKANRNKLSKAIAGSQELKTYRAANKAVADAKKAKFAEAAKVDGSDAKKALDGFADATQKYTEAVKKKVTEIIGRDDIKQAFDKIKKALPKEGQAKAAMIYGGIAAAVGLIAGLVLGNKNDVA